MIGKLVLTFFYVIILVMLICVNNIFAIPPLPFGQILVQQADCSTIISGFCVDTDDGNLYYWDGDSVELLAAPSGPKPIYWP
jgi:hypothetical protein